MKTFSDFYLFKKMAKYCKRRYGSILFLDKVTEDIAGFTCPECGDPIWFEDWVGADRYMSCPNCGEIFRRDDEEYEVEELATRRNNYADHS